MKAIKYIIGAVLGCMAAVSCISDDAFLEEKPKAQLTIANAYNTSDQVVNTLLTGYWEFEELYFPGSMGQGLCYNTFTGTDMALGDKSDGIQSFQCFVTEVRPVIHGKVLCLFL